MAANQNSEAKNFSCEKVTIMKFGTYEEGFRNRLYAIFFFFFLNWQQGGTIINEFTFLLIFQELYGLKTNFKLD